MNTKALSCGPMATWFLLALLGLVVLAYPSQSAQVIGPITCPDDTVPAEPSNFTSAVAGLTGNTTLLLTVPGTYALAGVLTVSGNQTLCIVASDAATYVIAAASGLRHASVTGSASLGLMNVTIQGAMTASAPSGGVQVM
jgi:hypothetical protein